MSHNNILKTTEKLRVYQSEQQFELSSLLLCHEALPPQTSLKLPQGHPHLSEEERDKEIASLFQAFDCFLFQLGIKIKCQLLTKQESL